jgi:hypothetical protein
MKDLIALQMQGWTLTCNSERVVRDLLGEKARRLSLTSKAGIWKVETPLPAHHPVGMISEVVTFDSDKQVKIDIVPGSQGQDSPPEHAGEAITHVIIEDKQTLMLDARCWYFIHQLLALDIGLWFCRPDEKHL